ncbi:cell wall-binding repeat-containing protein [Desulfosporosinus burensis]
MGKKTLTQMVVAVLMTVFLLIGMIPGVASAADSLDLGWLEFKSSTDSTLITGETSTINFKLFQSYKNPFTGSVNATITDPQGNETYYSVSGSQGNYSISNVTIDTAGDYTLIIIPVSPYTGSAGGTIKVVNAVTTVTGSLIVNTNNTMSVKVTDTDGNPLARKTVTVDGTKVGTTSQSATTLSDGTFTFLMSPATLGTVNIILAGHVIGSIPVVPAYTQNPRIGGTSVDNISLSIAIARSGWAQGTRTVILARDDQFSDAMAAVPLSKKFNAPILMTNSSTLDERTLAEMRNLGVSSVYIVGGTVAISQGIQDSLKEFAVTRIAGQQGFDTAALISSYVGIDASRTVFLANGHAIPDAIAASAFAAEQGSSILLTDREQLPQATRKALDDLNASNVVLLGGTAVISAQLEQELRTKYAVKRWGGYDRYDTQTIIFQNLLNTQTPQSPLYFTSGLSRQDDVSLGKPYADALLTAALAAKNGGFVAMLPPNTLPSSLNYYLLFNKGYISKSAVVGNNSGVSYDLEQQLQQKLNH